MNIGGLAYADGDQDDYSHQSGVGFHANLNVGAGVSFGGGLPPPPDEPPPPLPEGEAAVEKKKKKKKHREERGDGEGEDGERRHRKKKKKHREEGEDGERRKHRHRKRDNEEGEAGVTVDVPGVNIALPEANIDLDASGALPEGHHEAYQYEPPEVSGHFDGGGGVSAQGPSIPAFPSRFNDISNNSRPTSNSPRSMMKADVGFRTDSPLVQDKVDPAFDADAGSVEDYYYSSPRDSSTKIFANMPRPPLNPPPSLLKFSQPDNSKARGVGFGVSLGGEPEAVEVSPADVGGSRPGLQVRDAPSFPGSADFEMPDRPPIGVRTNIGFEPRDQNYALHGEVGGRVPPPTAPKPKPPVMPKPKVKPPNVKPKFEAKPPVVEMPTGVFAEPGPQFDAQLPSADLGAQGNVPDFEAPSAHVDVQGFNYNEPPFDPGMQGDIHGQASFEPPEVGVKGPGFKMPKFGKKAKGDVDVQGPGYGEPQMDADIQGDIHGQASFEPPQPEGKMKKGFKMPKFGKKGKDDLEIHATGELEMPQVHGEMQAPVVQGDFPHPNFDDQTSHDMQGQPQFEGQAGFDMQGQPQFDMQGQPQYDMQGQPQYGMQGQPQYDMQGQPQYDMQGQPQYDMQGQPQFDMQGQPQFDMQGQPQFDMQGGYNPNQDPQRFSMNDNYDIHDDVPADMQPNIHGEVDLHGPSMKGPKKKGGLFGSLFGSKRDKKAPHAEASLSGPNMEAPSASIGASGGPFVGSPMSTMRSGDSEVHRDPWQSNPQLFNPNADTMDPHLNAMGPAPNMGGRVGKKGKKLPSTRPIPTNKARVILLDGEELDIPVDKKAPGREIFDRVCDHQSIEERDYFGLTYVNRKEQTWFWLDMDKKISKQLKNGEAWFFNFQVKFYPPEPSLLQEDITRYQLSLQVRQDIFTGKLPCSWVTQALLGSLLVQSEIGDYDDDEHGKDMEYLRDFQFVHTQNEQLLNKIVELHKNHKGMNPGEADLKYLETAKRLELYGYDLHPARDLEDIDIFIGVSFTGIVVYRGHLRISRFAWPKVLRISYRKNFFYLKIRSDYYEDVEAVVGFKLFNHKLAKRLWKIAVEHHTFFRLKEPRMTAKTSTLPRFGSRHRFSGRTFYQYRTMSIQRPQGNPHFDRSLTKRRTASMPMLAGGGGSQFGSMHSLTRQHPRDMSLGKMQSVEYLGPAQPPRTPSMPRSGSVEFGGVGGSTRGPGSSVGGSMQYLPDSAGNRVLLHGGASVSARAGAPLIPRSKAGSESPQMQHFHTSYSPDVGGDARVQLQPRSNPEPQFAIRPRKGGSSIGSAEDDLL